MKTLLKKAFLDWTNNYISTSAFGAAYGLTDEQARTVIALGRELHEADVTTLNKLRQHVTGSGREPILEVQDYTVVAVSSNTNSFGLKSILLLSETGEGWEILKSPYNDGILRRGETYQRVGGEFQCGSYECPRRLTDTSPKDAVNIIKQAKQ